MRRKIKNKKADKKKFVRTASRIARGNIISTRGGNRL